jgi:phenylacetate-CoA ligase
MWTDAPYWNPLVETAPEEDLRAMQLRKFKRIFQWAWENSRFHRSIYEAAGIHPEDIRTLQDIRHIPKVDKSMMRDVQRKEPFPYGEALCVDPDDVTEFHQTSGTTGQPLYQPDTWEDWEWFSESWAYILWAQGYRPRDRVFIPFGYNIFVAFWAGHYAAERIGCEVVPGGVLDTQARVLKIQELRATAMMATPTYVLSMASVARERLGIDPATLTIERITCAGEPGALIPATKRRMEEAWGAKVFDHAGATEIGAWGYECEAQSGGLHVNEALFLVEIEDMETGEIIEGPGRRGRMIITALDRMAQPCIRFDSKDIIEWAPEPCPCGRTFRMVKGGVHGRADDIVKIKGVLFAPASVEDVVRAFPELSEEYELVVRKRGETDEILLKVELMPESEAKREEIHKRLLTKLRLVTNLGFVVEFHPYGSLPRYEVKARRFKDLRGET